MHQPISFLRNPQIGKGAKTGASHDWRSFYLSQYDWLKGSHMTKVVWLLNATDSSFVEPNTCTPYCLAEPRLGCHGLPFQMRRSGQFATRAVTYPWPIRFHSRFQPEPPHMCSSSGTLIGYQEAAGSPHNEHSAVAAPMSQPPSTGTIGC